MHAWREGDLRSFDVLFYRHRDGIYRLALAITRDPQAGEEIVIDTFARAHRALERLEPDDSLRPWLYKVAVNLSHNRKPRKGVVFSSLETSPAEAFATDERSPASLVERAETRRIVLAAIGALGEKHRVVVVLHYLNGLNLAEIAQIVDCPVGTVKSHLHYALARLKVRLSSHPGFELEPQDLIGGSSGWMTNFDRARVR